MPDFNFGNISEEVFVKHGWVPLEPDGVKFHWGEDSVSGFPYAVPVRTISSAVRCLRENDRNCHPWLIACDLTPIDNAIEDSPNIRGWRILFSNVEDAVFLKMMMN